MDNNNIINLKILITIITVLLVSTSSVLALGISTPFYPSKPLKMQPGETIDVPFTLVNGLNEETTIAFINLEESAEIAELISSVEYTVLPGTKNNKVILKISIPADANVGDSYDVRFSISSSESQKGNVIDIGVGYIVGFPVEVVNEFDSTSNQKQITTSDSTQKEIIPPPTSNKTTTPKKSNANTTIIIIVLILVIIIIVFWLLKKKKKV